MWKSQLINREEAIIKFKKKNKNNQTDLFKCIFLYFLNLENNSNIILKSVKTITNKWIKKTFKKLNRYPTWSQIYDTRNTSARNLGTNLNHGDRNLDW